ncbi:hypothetical protein JW758_03835 [Candidatus Peregrinibacteria bacterium]|nr:hypothetical protein [Candidatus Peregrinibacteria bacterium]
MQNEKLENSEVNPDINHDKVLLEWKTPEFIPYQRSKTWYITASIIIVGLLLYAILTGSITMFIVFVMIIILFALTQNKQPKILDAQITELGVRYGKDFFHYNTINSFWIVYHPPFVRVLYLRLGTGKSFKYVKIELNQQNPVQLRNTLGKEVPEIEGMGERSIDILSRLLRLQ